MTVTWSFAMVMGDNNIDDANKCRKLLPMLITMEMQWCKAGMVHARMGH